MDLRQIRGLEIARQNQVKESKDSWLVKSQSGRGFWRVGEDFSCNCPDAEFHKTTCKLFHYFQFNQAEFLEHYHLRPNVEATFSAIKRKLGERLKSKNDTARVNELLCKIIAYNLTVVIHEMKELGISPEFRTFDSKPKQ